MNHFVERAYSTWQVKVTMTMILRRIMCKDQFLSLKNVLDKPIAVVLLQDLYVEALSL